MKLIPCLLAVIFFHIHAFSQDTALTAAAGIEFILIKPGSYTSSRYEPVFNPTDPLARKLARKAAMPGFMVKIESPFYIGKFEITQQQWKAVMGTDPSQFKGDRKPVENISWNDALQFVEKLNQLDSLHHYRLPTEFEWEYAARAGEQDDISWDEIRLQTQMGIVSTADVGQKKPNAWGLYDMLGNVWEWVEDFYNEKMFADPVPPLSGTQHVLKGASFTGDVKNATYLTHAAGPGNKWDVGFRVVMETVKRNLIPAKSVKEASKHKSTSPVPGWHISRTSHQGTTPKVTYTNGIITMQQCPFGQGGVLLTDRKYRDVEISVEVKIDSFCNGGIFLRSSESGQAYQVELAEPGATGNVFGEMMRISKPGEANKEKVWKANDWNLFRIRMTGAVPRIEVWINGQLMYDITEPANDFIAGATEGMIGLQAHWSSTFSPASKAFDMSGSWKPGEKHQFRNLKITDLGGKIN